MSSLFSLISHVMPGFDVWSVFPYSLHGEFLHHSCCSSSEAQEQETETKESVIEINKSYKVSMKSQINVPLSNQS